MKVYVLISETEERYTSIMGVYEDEQIARSKAKRFQNAEEDGDYYTVEAHNLIKKADTPMSTK